MGSLTQSLLSSSAEKTSQDADNLKSSQNQTVAAGKGLKKAISETNTGQKPSGGLKQMGSDIKSGVQKVMGSFHDGGTVPKTGPYKLHEGEEVIPAKRASEYRKVYLGRKSKKD